MPCKFVCLMIVGCALIGAGCEGTGDRLEVPTPDPAAYGTMTLTCLHATSNDFVVVGGYLTRINGVNEALILKSENGGERWVRLGSETENLDDLIFQSIHFNDARRGWVSGIRVVDGQTIPSVYRTDDGGGHWSESFLPQDRSTVVTAVSELRFRTDEIGTTHVHFFDTLGGVEQVNIFESSDAGRHWIIKDFKEAAAVIESDPAEVFVTESQGFRLSPALENGTQFLYYTGSKGEHWVPRAQFHVSQLLLYY